jgi:hypothetical protein
MKKGQTARGIHTPVDFAEHIRRVEEFISWNDPVTKLLERLQNQVEQSGAESLGRTARMYLAINEFNDAVGNGCVHLFFSVAPLWMQDAVNEGLLELEEHALAAEFDQLRQQFREGKLSEEAEEDPFFASSFVDNSQELFSKLDSLAIEQGLLR